MRMKARGYTLMELLIAVSLSMVVLMAVFGMMTSMFRFQIEGLKKSTLTGWSLASLMKMNREIESTSVMVYPTAAGAVDWYVGCTNWSRVFGTAMDTNQSVDVFYYCYDAAGLAIRRQAALAAGSCPASYAPPACNAAWSTDVIAVGVNRYSSGLGVFTKQPGRGGVRVRYTVGEKTFTHVSGKPDVVNPQYAEFDTSISLSRAYLNTND